MVLLQFLCDLYCIGEIVEYTGKSVDTPTYQPPLLLLHELEYRLSLITPSSCFLKEGGDKMRMIWSPYPHVVPREGFDPSTSRCLI
jgi:hypothetical protein